MKSTGPSTRNAHDDDDDDDDDDDVGLNVLEYRLTY